MFGCYIYRCDHRSFAMGVADDLFCRLVSEYNVTLSTNCVFFGGARPKIKRHKCPCNYYSHASATFHLPVPWLFGSLTEPGPEPHRHFTKRCTVKCNHKRSIQGKDLLMASCMHDLSEITQRILWTTYAKVRSKFLPSLKRGSVRRMRSVRK